MKLRLVGFLLMGVFLKETIQQQVVKHKISFCESYEDYEECKPQTPVGPDGPIDDGEGGGSQDEPGPDDLGDGL